jgi:two-component system NarL family response regulator
MSIRILLADDHQIMRDGLRAILAAEPGFQIVGEAENGRDAAAIARTLVPDVVIMDIGMPDLNGVEATRQIKADNPVVKVIALSMYADRGYVLGILEAGASGYVLKTGAYDELQRAVKAVIQGKTYLSPDVTQMVVDAQVRGPAQDGASPQTRLGPREREIVQLLAEGHTSPEIARRMHISTRTVETHRRNIMKKLDLHSVAELTKYAIREGLTSLDR